MATKPGKPSAGKKSPSAAAVKVTPAAKKAAAAKAPPKHEVNVGPLDAQGRAYGTGRRKNAIARVWVKRGSGKITINGRDVTQYFARPVLRMIINQPFSTLNRVGNFDVEATVTGGGLSGQAGAVRHGLSRALDTFDQEFHTALRRGGFLTRDSRVVERKKYGKRKARRSFQFSKR